jgi:sulfur carrier protein ThiS adenylyltransferase
MVTITVNERPVRIEPGETLDGVRRRFKPSADVVILNGFPIEGDYPLVDGDRVTLIARGEQPRRDELEALLVARHTPGVHEPLKRACVGIAGCGGLGSHVALSLARVGVGHLILVDPDVVEPSNLNRQHYFVDQIGAYKVDALQETLLRANPFVRVETHRLRLTRENIPFVFAAADVIVEAFDTAEAKVMIIEAVLGQLPGRPLVVGSGMAGYGRSNAIHTRREGDLIICGDEVTEARPGRGLMAPRVGIAANHQANAVVEILVGQQEEP